MANKTTRRPRGAGDRHGLRHELELRLTNPNTKAVTTVTRQEQAYSVQDAIMQAIANQHSQPETGSADIKVMHVGPSRAALELANRELLQRLEGTVDRLLAKGRLSSAADAIRKARG